VERNKENNEDKKFKFDIGEVSENLFPFDSSKEKIKKNNGQEKEYAKSNKIFFHDERSILSSGIFQVNVIHWSIRRTSG
jgi:hypothetical protein